MNAIIFSYSKTVNIVRIKHLEKKLKLCNIYYMLCILHKSISLWPHSNRISLVEYLNVVVLPNMSH